MAGEPLGLKGSWASVLHSAFQCYMRYLSILILFSGKPMYYIGSFKTQKIIPAVHYCNSEYQLRFFNI